MNEDLTITQAAKYLHVTRQAIYVATKSGKLIGYKHNNRWMFALKELDAYLKRKFDRKYSVMNGKLRFDPKKGELSAKDVSKSLNVPIQRAYYLLRSGTLKHFRKGSSYVVLVRDMEEAKKILNHNRAGVIPVGSYDSTESNGNTGSMGSS